MDEDPIDLNRIRWERMNPAERREERIRIIAEANRAIRNQETRDSNGEQQQLTRPGYDQDLAKLFQELWHSWER